jgi:hypothetical protein
MGDGEMGITVSIFRNSRYDGCANGGISERVTELTITNIDGPFEPSDHAPAAMLVRGNLPRTVKVVPVEGDDKSPDTHTPYMSGGTHVATSDSRWNKAIRAITGEVGYSRIGAVALHDRKDTWEEDRTLSL